MCSKEKNDSHLAKDRKIHELELLVKDLRAELKEHHGLKDKLLLSNRNSRVLEEENAYLITQLKGIEGGETAPKFSHTNVEAMKLVDENRNLRKTLESALLDTEKSKEDFQAMVLKYESHIHQLTEGYDRMARENDRLTKDLESARDQRFEIQSALEVELAALKEEMDVLVREKERLIEKNAAMASSMKHSDNSRSASLEPHLRSGAAEASLKERLLKEDVEELETKLKSSEERLWQRGKEWLLTEAKFRNEISTLRETSNKRTNDKEVYRALHNQISALKRELAASRENTHSTCQKLDAKRAPPNSQLFTTEDMVNKIDNSNPSATPMGVDETDFSQRQLDLYNRIESLTKERDNLRYDLDNLNTTLLQLQSDIEKDVLCKELEIKLATSNRMSCAKTYTTPDSSLISDNELQRKYEHFPRGSKNAQEGEAASLKEKVKVLQSQLKDLYAVQEQKDAIHSIRLKEYENRITELLGENDSLHQRLNRSSFEKARPSRHDQDHFESALDFMRDKHEAVDEIMCQLESTWAREEEASHQIRESSKQDIVMTRYDAMKEENMRRLQRTIADLENQLTTEQSNHDLIDKLKSELVQKNNEVLFLNNEIHILSEDLHDAKKSARASSRSFEKEREASKRRSRGVRSVSAGRKSRVIARGSKVDTHEQQLVETRSEINRVHSRISKPSGRSTSVSNRATSINSQIRTPERAALSRSPAHSSEGTRKIAVLSGVHLAITIVELSNLMRKGHPITDPGYIIIKLKSIKEKYSTSIKELKAVIPFDETFQFFLAKPNQDVITLHIFYKTKNNPHVYHVGDACFSMVTLCRGVPRRRIAPVVHYPGTANAHRAAYVEVILQTDDFGRLYHPSEAELEEETLRFKDLVNKLERTAPEKLHAVDVYMASSALL